MFLVLLIFKKNCKFSDSFDKVWIKLRLCFSCSCSDKSNWQNIVSQTNVFNIFPASALHNTVAKIIQSKYILQSKKYAPARSLWLNRVFTDLANSDKKHCLTIDCRYINKNRPGRYSPSAENPEKQVCCFN